MTRDREAEALHRARNIAYGYCAHTGDPQPEPVVCPDCEPLAQEIAEAILVVEAEVARLRDLAAGDDAMKRDLLAENKRLRAALDTERARVEQLFRDWQDANGVACARGLEVEQLRDTVTALRAALDREPEPKGAPQWLI